MSEALKTTDQPRDSNPATVPLDRIEIWQPHRFENYTFWPYFERLRKDDPVHYTAESPYGPFWSITKFDDIVYVDTNHDIFSSEGDIAIDDDAGDFEPPMFIAMDPPNHDAAAQDGDAASSHRRTWPSSKALIRERAGQHPRRAAARRNVQLGRQGVSIELTTQMLATLFDFPFEDRHKLTYWSDVAPRPTSSAAPFDARKAASRSDRVSRATSRASGTSA